MRIKYSLISSLSFFLREIGDSEKPEKVNLLCLLRAAGVTVREGDGGLGICREVLFSVDLEITWLLWGWEVGNPLELKLQVPEDEWDLKRCHRAQILFLHVTTRA